jgi:hypothetical protein
MKTRLGLTTLFTATVLSVPAAATPPTGISPGMPERIVTIDDTCPTFSWTLVSRARGYELVVAELEGRAENVNGPLESSPVVRIQLPEGSASWTPSGHHCLEPGRSYAWSVRAVASRRPGGWSPGLAFAVSEAEGSDLVADLLDRITALESESTRWQDAARPTASSLLPDMTVDPGLESSVQQIVESELDGSGAIEAENSATSGEAYGILGISNSADKNAAGVAGENTVTSGRSVGILGVAYSPEGTGVRGMNLATDPSPGSDRATGVKGSTTSPDGVGVTGIAESPTGENAGVVGVATSPSGWGGLFFNESGGSLIAATSTPTNLATLDFEVESDGTVRLTGFLALTPFDSPPACTDVQRGWVYFDDSMNALCVCPGGSGPWARVDGGGSCT